MQLSTCDTLKKQIMFDLIIEIEISNFAFRLFFILSIWFFSVQCESENDDVCSTQACELEAENILAKLDMTADACEDFYLFACGNFLNETEIPDDKTSVDESTLLDDTLGEQLCEVLNKSVSEEDISPFVASKKLYQACLNEGKSNENLSQKFSQ